MAALLKAAPTDSAMPAIQVTPNSASTTMPHVIDARRCPLPVWRVAMREIPQPVRPITSTVRIATAWSRRRRAASRSVRRAMMSSGIGCISQELQKALFQRLVAGLDGVDPSAQAHQRGDQIGHGVVGDAAYGVPAVLIAHVAQAAQRRVAGPGQARHAQAHAV